MSDDVEIIDVNDDGEEMPVVHKRSLVNQDLGFLIESAGDFLGEYGWLLLFMTVCAIVLIQYLSKKRASQSQDKSSSNEPAQDPALVVRRQEAQEASRRRLQEQLDAKAVEYREKQEKLEEEKRRQKIEIWESMQEGKSYRAKVASQGAGGGDSSSSTVLKPKSDKKLRSDYNPLAGDGGASCSWRPPRRGPTSGG